MPKRVQSPSSINTYKQCPRKYYFQYVEKLPTKPSPETTRGNVAHHTLEQFFDTDVKGITKKDCRSFLQNRIIELMLKNWDAAKKEWDIHKMTPVQTAQLKEGTVVMLFNWLNHFINRVLAMDCEFPEAFAKLVPAREEFLESSQYMVRGYIDAIEMVDGKVHIIDYKTSKAARLSQEYKLQMAIYLLLYQEKHGGLPDKASFFFLRHHPLEVKVEQDLVDAAKREIMTIHAKTENAEKRDEYAMQPGPLCGWCNFKIICFPKR